MISRAQLMWPIFTIWHRCPMSEVFSRFDDQGLVSTVFTKRYCFEKKKPLLYDFNIKVLAIFENVVLFWVSLYNTLRLFLS